MTARTCAAILLAFACSMTRAAPPADCGRLVTKYFSRAALKVYPPRPARPESAAWAREQEAKGGAYYIAEYCDDGRIVSLTKRLNRATFFRYDYSYESGKLAGLRLTDQGGRSKIVARK